MKNCTIIHGCTDKESDKTYFKHWIPWLKNQLEKKGIKVSAPLMPTPWSPDYESWKNKFDKLQINEETILIGHSCGSAFLVRYLGNTKKKVKKLILVAPWILPNKEFSDGENKMYNFKIDGSIKDRVLKTIIFTSDDGEEDLKKSAKIFQEALNGKLIELKGHGHYIQEDMGTEEFPELLEEVLK